MIERPGSEFLNAKLARLRTVIDRVLGVAAVAAGIMLVVQVLLVALDSVMRSLGIPIVWGVEINSYLLIAETILSAPWALRRGAHFRITLFHDRWKEATARRVDVGIYILLAVVLAVLAWNAGELALDAAHRNQVSPTLLRIPQALPLSVFAIGLVLFAFAAVASAIETRLGDRPSEQDAAVAADTGF